MWQTPCPGLPYRPVMRTQGVKGAQRHYYRVGSHLNFQTVKNETFHSVPELSGTYRGSFDVKSISSMTSGDFSDVYKYSGMQALFVTGRALLFLFESSWKYMKNDTTFVRMRSGDHIGDAKMSKRAPRSADFNFYINYDRQKRFSQHERRADLQNFASDF